MTQVIGSKIRITEMLYNELRRQVRMRILNQRLYLLSTFITFMQASIYQAKRKETDGTLALSITPSEILKTAVRIVNEGANVNSSGNNNHKVSQPRTISPPLKDEKKEKAQFSTFDFR